MHQTALTQFARGISAGFEELSQLELPVSRKRADVLEGNPVESFKRLFDDGNTVSGIWECTPGRFAIEKRGVTSLMYFLSGRARVSHREGTVHELGAGSLLITPDGFSGEWDISETARKFYVTTRVGKY